ncbi:hypothetical protein KSS87_011941 [Heliosperma pusillum]|nr:hypothetical protein KSS87_011941 [Heliosperma pusillum]
MADTKVKMSVKLLVDKQTKRVLFAEAGKDVVDFLFNLMSLPVATVVKLLNSNNMVGSLGALYKSIESLSLDYFQPNLTNDVVLKPKTALNIPLLSLNDDPSSNNAIKVYRCKTHPPGYITDSFGTACPNCGAAMSTEVKWVNSMAAANVASVSSGLVGSLGYVKGVVTYMVMDNLEVKPMSTISGITLINKFHVKDVSTLTEKVLDVGLKEHEEEEGEVEEVVRDWEREGVVGLRKRWGWG